MLEFKYHGTIKDFISCPSVHFTDFFLGLFLWREGCGVVGCVADKSVVRKTVCRKSSLEQQRVTLIKKMNSSRAWLTSASLYKQEGSDDVSFATCSNLCTYKRLSDFITQVTEVDVYNTSL